MMITHSESRPILLVEYNSMDIDLLAFGEVVKQINAYWPLINEPPFQEQSRRSI